MSTTETGKQCPSIHAKNALESIVEMVAALQLDTAARHYANQCDTEKAVKLLQEYHHPEPIDYTAISEERIKEELFELIDDEEIIPPDFEFNEEEARDTILEDALAIETRGGWHSPGEMPARDDEYRICLTTGGPAVQITGELDQYGEPNTAEIQGQDWFTPWVSYRDTTEEEDQALLTYAQQFYWGN